MVTKSGGQEHSHSIIATSQMPRACSKTNRELMAEFNRAAADTIPSKKRRLTSIINEKFK